MSLFASVSFLFCFWADVEKIAFIVQLCFFSDLTLSASLSSFLLLRSFLLLFPSCFTRRRHRSCSAPPAHAPRLSRRHLRTRADYPGVAPSSARRLCVSATVVSPVSLLVLCYWPLASALSLCSVCWSLPPPLWPVVAAGLSSSSPPAAL